MRQILVVFLRAVLALGLLLVVGFAILAWQVDRLGQRDLARPADAIVVLGARVNTDGSPGPDLAARTYHAAALYRAGYAPALICTGGYKGERLSAASVCRRYAMALAVPEEAIWLADGSSNTAEDAAVTRSVMDQNGWHDAVLVSHPLHLFRTRWLFRRAGISAVTSPTSTETDRIFPPLRAWYAVREAGAIVLTTLDGWDVLPERLVTRLQQWSYATQ